MTEATQQQQQQQQQQELARENRVSVSGEGEPMSCKVVICNDVGVKGPSHRDREVRLNK